MLKMVGMVLFLSFGFALAPRFSLAAQGGADAEFVRAMKDLERGKPSAAKAALLRLVRKKSSKGLYWFNLASIYFKEGRYPSAIECYKRVVLLKSGLSPAARLFMARSYRMSGRPGAALEELRSLPSQGLPPALSAEVREETLENLGQWMDSGLKDFDEGRYEDAIRKFDQVSSFPIEDQRWAENARMMKGLALFRIDRAGEARDVFEGLIRAGSNPALRENSRFLFRAAQRAQARGRYPWWSFLDLSAGWNSNVFGNASGDAPDSSPFHHAMASAGTRFFKRGDYTAGGAFSVGVDQFYYESAARVLQSNLSADFSIDNPSGWRFLSPFIAFEMYGSRPSFYRPGFSVGIGGTSRRRDLGVDYTFTQKLPASVDFEYGRGAIHELKAHSSWIQPNEIWTASLGIGTEASQPLPLANGSIPLARNYLVPGIAWKKLASLSRGSPWEFNASLAYQLSFFDQSRKDRQLLGNATLARWIDRSSKVYLDLTFSRNDSTLDSSSILDRNFSQWILASGFSWDIHQ